MEPVDINYLAASVEAASAGLSEASVVSSTFLSSSIIYISPPF